MKKTNKISSLIFSLLASLLVASHAEEVPKYDYGQGSNSKMALPSAKNNKKMKPNQKIEKNNFEININPDIVDDIAAKRLRFKKALNQTYRLELNMHRVNKPLKEVDKLYITTEYSTTIILPTRYGVIKVLPSEDFEVKEFSENMITFKPGKSFVEGNLVISFTDGIQNRLMTILLEKYSRKAIASPRYTSSLSRDKNMVNTLIAYVDKPRVSNIKILEAYMKLYDKPCGAVFKKDGNFDIFTFQDFPYYIIRDDKFGEVEVDGINFRIANEYNSFAEQVRYEKE